jgi:hypothetical protein
MLPVGVGGKPGAGDSTLQRRVGSNSINVCLIDKSICKGNQPIIRAWMRIRTSVRKRCCGRSGDGTRSCQLGL